MIEPPTPNYDFLLAIELSPIKRYGNRKRLKCSPKSMKLDVDLDSSGADFGNIEWLENELDDYSRAGKETRNPRQQWF